MVDTRRKRSKEAGSVVFTCPWITIRQDAIGTSGSPLDYYYVLERPDSVTIVPISGHRTILLRQHRHPIDRASWEFPMGQIEAGETAEMAAERELHEESGIVSDRLEAISWYHPIAGLTAQRTFVFLAWIDDQRLRGAKFQPGVDDIRALRVVEMSTVAEMIGKGEIHDGATIAAFTLCRMRLARPE
jgi:8-oxo-dGTP pyrophosphatase MutT (NUDIX family)